MKAALGRVSRRIAEQTGEPASWQIYLDSDERDALLANCCEENRYIAKRYLGREDEILFREKPNQDGTEPNYPGLSAERAMRVRSYLDDELRRPSVRWLLLLSRIGSFVKGRAGL